MGDPNTDNTPFIVRKTPEQIQLATPQLEAAFRKRGYVSGIAAGSFLDKATGFRDPGFGLDIADWLMEPGSDVAYRSLLPGDLVYEYNNPQHGRVPKRIIEGPQICTRAGELPLELVRGGDSITVRTQYRFPLAAPGKQAGSLWRQSSVFPAGKRYYLSHHQISTVNDSEALFFRLDMPGHIRHQEGDTFSEIYLSYCGTIPSDAFLEDFPPDARYRYRRDSGNIPERFIRAYRLRNPQTGADGPWLAGMTLDPAVVYEAWCHQRGYVCFIQEIGGAPIRAGESFGATFLIGYFDSIDEMNAVYDSHAGTSFTPG